MSEIDGCLYCEAAQRTTWMITHLAPPVTIQSCEEHIPQNLIGVLSQVMDVDYTRLYGAVEKFMTAEAKRHAKEVEAEAERLDREGAFDADTTEAPEDGGTDEVQAG